MCVVLWNKELRTFVKNKLPQSVPCSGFGFFSLVPISAMKSPLSSQKKKIYIYGEYCTNVTISKSLLITVPSTKHCCITYPLSH